MKRILQIMLVVVLSVLIFSACACSKKKENDAIRFDSGTFLQKIGTQLKVDMKKRQFQIKKLLLK